MIYFLFAFGNIIFQKIISVNWINKEKIELDLDYNSFMIMNIFLKYDIRFLNIIQKKAYLKMKIKNMLFYLNLENWETINDY